MREELNPTALSSQQLARLMTRVGGEPVSERQIAEDIDQGAPVNPDGTINLIHYAAWLAREARGNSRGGNH